MAAYRMLPGLNNMLADAAHEDYANVQAAVEAAETVRDAVEAVGILETLEESVAFEARAVLDAIPAAVDSVIIAALESAFERGAAVFLDWLEGDRGAIEVRISEEPHGDTVQVRIVFVSPNGATFLV
jgi:hypothetical protein